MSKTFYVYMLANRRGGTLYTGVTSDLVRRVEEHRIGVFSGFTDKYSVDRLVWYETHRYADQAILREKRIKRWRREWKDALIEFSNPEWRDLYDTLPGDSPDAG